MIHIEAEKKPENSLDKKFKAWLEEMQTARPAISTTIPQLDNILGGLHGLTIIGGGPGTGKTALAIQISQQYARKGGPVVFLSYEQGPAGFYSRIMQRETGIAPKNHAKALQGENKETLAGWLEGVIAEMTNLLLFGLPDDEKEKEQLAAVKDAVLSMQEATGKTALLVVDSLHYVPLGAASAGLDGKRAIDAALKIFTKMQQATGAAVVLISHQTKSEVKSKSGGLMDFSGSATISYACDIAIQLQREDGATEVLISVPKNRFGETNSKGFEENYNLIKQIIG